MRFTKANGWWVIAGALAALSGVNAQASPSRYVDHDTAVKMGSVGNYVSENELKVYQDRMALQSSLKDQVASREKTLLLPSDEAVVFFSKGGAQLTPQGKKEIAMIAQQVEDDPSLAVEVNGYTDTTGNELTNRELSKDRAEAVKGELLNQGVEEKQIKTEAFGNDDPIASNDDDQGRAMNRRAELYIENSKEAIG